MPDEQYHPLGHVAGTEVGVQSKLDGQDIIVQHNEVGHRLACLLAPGPANAQVFWRGEDLYWRIPHTQRVDRLLTELIDLFISIRHAHPVLVQLEKELEPGSP